MENWLLPIFITVTGSAGKTRESLSAQLEDHGFVVDVWEDKSEYLSQLVVDCIMKGECMDTLWQCLLQKGENRGLTREDIKRYKPGYFLLIASKEQTRKQEEHMHLHREGGCGGCSDTTVPGEE